MVCKDFMDAETKNMFINHFCKSCSHYIYGECKKQIDESEERGYETFEINPEIAWVEDATIRQRRIRSRW